jgi:hypothetical protein
MLMMDVMVKDPFHNIFRDVINGHWWRRWVGKGMVRKGGQVLVRAEE